jgi:hypothetical protein
VLEDKREAVARYLHRANYTLPAAGRFEFEEGSGEVRFTTVLDVADGDVTTCRLFVLYAAHRVADYHLEPLLKLILFDVPPARTTPIFDKMAGQWLQQGDLLDLLGDIDVDNLNNGDSV